MSVIRFLVVAFLVIGLVGCGGPAEQPTDEVEVQPDDVFTEDFESGETEPMTGESVDPAADESATQMDFEEGIPEDQTE